MRVHYLQHEPFEGLGCLESWFRGRGAQLTASHVYEDPRFPEIGAFDWLVILGGGMSVNDESQLPWLRPEKAFVRAACAAGRTVLGVCLGAQMIASALGARVFRNPLKEIGWWPILREPDADRHPVGRVQPARAEVFHWHGDTFALPAGTVPLASSDACANQGFASPEGQVIGLQFHLEMRDEDVHALVENGREELAGGGPHVQTEEEILAGHACHGAPLGPLLEAMLDRWLG
jgi:GMP synthase-like glutamine amidotransferase